MSKRTDTYKRLGDYIRQVDVRNKDLRVERLLGVNLSKQFIPSVANIIGTDLSKYKVIHKRQFGCKLMSVGRDGILPISLYRNDEPSIISSAYYVFEVIDENILLPEFLFMWITRPEFDRQLSFYAGADVRGGVTWDFLCDMPIVVPSIDRQREIVAQYETLTRRIRINEQMIARLEDAAQALYRKMFVDGIDKENLPEGWRMGTLTEIATYTNGLACQKYETHKEPFLPVIKIRELNQGYVDENSNHALLDVPQELIVRNGDVIFAWSASLMIEFWCGGKGVLNQHLFKVESKEYPSWFYYLATKSHIVSWSNMISAKATSMGHIKREDLENANVIIGSRMFMERANKQIAPIYDHIILKKQEQLNLRSLQSLLLTRLTQTT